MLAVLLSLFVPVKTSAQGDEAVRAIDRMSADAIRHGRTGSQAFRTLLEDIAASAVIVHVLTGDTALFGTDGTTRLAGVRAGWRYLRVVLRPQLSADERAAVLAHELQHVREIAQYSATTQAVRNLYDEIGRPVPGTHNAFETAEASDAGLKVWRELRAFERQARREAALHERQQ